ncbi:patatin-like phospholipase family protein [Crenobacter sp. SG2303]|uniref:Patatin-like phospholipase family protein n=1 Tax=Crenobacter oryzisoli TaxID=3056844 RepID=A0ABT7XPD4_9NEIS|nr:patatin-like phospholipase family protein [Crenobacter sp. SG2303]MDN0075429.1 patatin-like phospholipase family protein [Crenobacter sp. SG2303]
MSGSSEKTAFVFAGGGSLGAVEVGMLRELLAYGERADVVVGASAGAINGAYFAGRPDADGVAALAALWGQLRRRDIMPMTMLGLFNMILRRRQHLVEASALRALLVRHLPFSRLEDASLPLHVVATDLLSGDEVVLGQGPAVDAVLASAAIPGVFPPVELNGHMLVDGGVANNTPVSVAVKLGARRVIVLPAGFACALQQPPRSVIAQAMHALTLLIARQLVNDIRAYAPQAAIHVIPPLCPLNTSPYDYSQCGRLIELAAERTRQWLRDGGLETPTLPSSLLEHHH